MVILFSLIGGYVVRKIVQAWGFRTGAAYKIFGRCVETLGTAEMVVVKVGSMFRVGNA